MNLKEKIQDYFIAFENKFEIDTGTRIHKIRRGAFETFQQQGFPNKKQEQWRYTNLNLILKQDYTLLMDNSKTALEYGQVKPYFLNQTDCYNLVFIDGVFSSFLSETTHEGLDVCVLSAALSKDKYKRIVEQYFHTMVTGENNNPFTDLNTAFTTEGAYIRIPKNVVVPKPIQIINLCTATEKPLLLQPRNLIIVEENAEVQIIERHQSLNNTANFTNTVSEVFVEKNATVDIYKIQNDVKKSHLVDTTFISQKSQSTAEVHTFSFGGKLTRNNLSFFQKESRCCSNLNGLSILDEKQYADNYTLVRHDAPDCESNEMYKGIYEDASVGVFNGRVIVDRLAQRINAFQQNNNILLGDKANVNTKPQLEIFADDVKCSHGCTIGQLDETALFYMRQRGIPEKQARALLLYAFSGENLKSIKITELKTRINQMILEKLAIDIGFNF